VVGEYYGDEDKYQTLIKTLKIEDDLVVVNKYIDDSEVGIYFCASDLVIQPYRNATQSGVTPIAYHFEIPILVTNVGGLPEMVPHEKVGYVVEVSPDAIKNAIQQFYSENKKEEFTSNIKIEKEKYGWEILSNGIIHLSEL
jgi:glycosyltransferase involved in cell wall biosynthesis